MLSRILYTPHRTNLNHALKLDEEHDFLIELKHLNYVCEGQTMLKD
jgi:hypothetical protein